MKTNLLARLSYDKLSLVVAFCFIPLYIYLIEIFKNPHYMYFSHDCISIFPLCLRYNSPLLNCLHISLYFYWDSPNSPGFIEFCLYFAALIDSQWTPTKRLLGIFSSQNCIMRTEEILFPTEIVFAINVTFSVSWCLWFGKKLSPSPDLTLDYKLWTEKNTFYF